MKIAGLVSDLTAHIRKATVTALNADGTLNVDLDGEPVEDVDRLRSYDPVVGDHPLVLVQSGAVVALGASADDPATWTPVLAASTTAPTLGTGSTATGRLNISGGMVFATFNLTFGSSGVAAGNGNYQLSLPVNAAESLSAVGAAVYKDASTAGTAGFRALTVVSSTPSIAIFAIDDDAPNPQVTHAVPWTPAAGDSIRGYLTYAAA